MGSFEIGVALEQLLKPYLGTERVIPRTESSWTSFEVGKEWKHPPLGGVVALRQLGVR